MNDNLIECPHCGGACYEVENSPTISTKSCMVCGFTTNSLMKEDEEFYKEQLEILPELYKDIVFTDKDGFKWIPTTVNLPDRKSTRLNSSHMSESRMPSSA